MLSVILNFKVRVCVCARTRACAYVRVCMRVRTHMLFLQVMEIIRDNYGSLTLRLHDNLDYYEKYSEKPHEKAFFTQLVRHC